MLRLRRPDAAPHWRLLAAAVAIAAVVRLIPASIVYGSDDVAGWHRLSDTMALKGDPYSTGLVNWPPLWPWIVHAEAKLTTLLGLPFHFVVKLGPLLADLGITAVLFLVAARGGRSPRGAFAFAMLFALNPVSIFTTSFHGQFDGIAALFGLLAVVSADARPKGIASGLWLGLGGLTKTWPLIFLPALLRVGDWRRRGYVAYLALLPAVATVVLTLDLVVPNEARQYVLNYQSFPYWWGVTSLNLYSPGEPWTWYAAHGNDVLYVAFLVVLVLCRHRSNAQTALAMVLTFYVFTPGYGTQYLVWVLPFALLADTGWAIAYSALAGVELLAEYIMRPWDGGHWGFLSVNARSAAFLRDYNSHHDLWATDLLRLSIWAFTIVWLGRLLLLSHRARPGRVLVGDRAAVPAQA
jgi:hypothetical protein